VASAASAKTKKDSTSTEATSLPGLCLAASLKHGKAKAFNHKVDGQWVNTSAGNFVERVKDVALGFGGDWNSTRRSNRVAVRE